MAWANLADLAIKATRHVFGVPIVYTPALTGLPSAITAPFDEAAKRVVQQGDTWIEATCPLLTVRLADLPVMPAQHDAVTVAGHAYEVSSVEPDGQGCAKLYLLRTA
jgi:hypothetical protein